MNDRNEPAIKECFIDEIEPTDERVLFIGRVVNSSTNTLLIDDGRGKIVVVTSNALKYNPGDIVRVFGTVIAEKSESFYVNAEIIQNFNGLNVSLYQELLILKKNITMK